MFVIYNKSKDLCRFCSKFATQKDAVLNSWDIRIKFMLGAKSKATSNIFLIFYSSQPRNILSENAHNCKFILATKCEHCRLKLTTESRLTISLWKEVSSLQLTKQFRISAMRKINPIPFKTVYFTHISPAKTVGFIIAHHTELILYYKFVVQWQYSMFCIL